MNFMSDLIQFAKKVFDFLRSILVHGGPKF
ncbi:hypothetical protein ACUXFG_001720 [Staphylococcus capitis]|nr:hypothetical protein AYP1020_2163 [Staphylococcus capitis subsp. capitis]VTR19728.1 Uncharacterised protein [Staphylococcus capitis]